jgi:lipoate-protein ligase B
MTVEVAGAIETTIHRFHVTVNHVAGAMGVWMLKRKQKVARFSTQLMNWVAP